MRMTQIIVEGKHYSIPEMWFVGFLRNGGTVQDAALHWHEQAVMAEEHDREPIKARARIVK
jgi:hypothetical protein